MKRDAAPTWLPATLSHKHTRLTGLGSLKTIVSSGEHDEIYLSCRGDSEPQHTTEDTGGRGNEHKPGEVSSNIPIETYLLRHRNVFQSYKQ